MSHLLEIRDLQVTFGGLDALSGLNFHIDEGEIVSVIGPNGAGKTTFFNTISGLVEPTSGDILFEDESIRGLDPNQVTSLGIARTFQNVRQHDHYGKRHGGSALPYFPKRDWGVVPNQGLQRRRRRDSREC